MPKVAIAPLIIIWFGYGVIAKLVLAAVLAFFPMLVNFIEGLRSADEGRLKLMQSASCAAAPCSGPAAWKANGGRDRHPSPHQRLCALPCAVSHAKECSQELGTKCQLGRACKAVSQTCRTGLRADTPTP
jgi:hypothetical protein